MRTVLSLEEIFRTLAAILDSATVAIANLDHNSLQRTQAAGKRFTKVRCKSAEVFKGNGKREFVLCAVDEKFKKPYAMKVI